MNRQQISEKELLFLLTGFVIGTSVVLIPPSVVAEARQDAWLALLMAALPSIILVKILFSLQKMFPGESLIQYSILILGYPLGKILGGIFLWYTVHLSSSVLRVAGDFVQLLILPTTPMIVIHLVIIIIIIYSIKSGLEVFSRASTFLMPFPLFFFLLISILVFSKSDFSRFLPFMENGLPPMLLGASKAMSIPFGQLIVFSMILFQVKKIKHTERFAITGLLIGLIFLDINIFRSVAVVGVESSIRYFYPTIETVREAPSGNILEAIIVVNWFIFMFVKLSICLYVSTLGISQWIGVKDYRIIATPVGVLVVPLSILIYANSAEESFFLSKIWPYYAIPFEYCIPLLLWLAAKIKSRINSSKR